MSRIRIVVVDDHEMVRHGLRLSLELEPDMDVVGEARTGEDAVRVARTSRPDVMLLDVRLEDVDGPEVCREVLAASPKTAVVMLTSFLHDSLILRSLVAGAKGYVIKDIELAELKKMVRRVYQGNAVLDPRVTTQVIATAAGGRAPCAAAALSDVDVRIIRGLADGLTNKEIGARIHRSPHTVKDHVQKICLALDVGSRTEVVAEAFRRGLI
jgi:DNA-binding NarL/FixJ family response regulator